MVFYITLQSLDPAFERTVANAARDHLESVGLEALIPNHDNNDNNRPDANAALPPPPAPFDDDIASFDDDDDDDA